MFLFAVDIQQLSHSISSVYGQGFDSVGYLCRFFDYIAKMPEADISQYILDNISNIEPLKGMTDFSVYNPNIHKSFCEILKAFLKDVYIAFDFSLRNLNTIIQSYKIMFNNFLFNYNDASAHMIYIFFLSLKYKFPKLFSSIFIDSLPIASINNDVIYKKLLNWFDKRPTYNISMRIY